MEQEICFFNSTIHTHDMRINNRIKNEIKNNKKMIGGKQIWMNKIAKDEMKLHGN